jgi:DNA (cytosine-5)-methyltransferase 1
MRKRRVIDLFSGAGGFSLGAHAAGFATALAVDVDKDLTYCFKDNFPHTPLLIGDLSRLDPRRVLNNAGIPVGSVDVVIGGPPCQGFSYMGKRNPKDRRNRLIEHFFLFVAFSQPAYFVMENVPGLLSPQFQPVLKQGIEKVQSFYEVVGPILVDSADFGAATRRKRALVVGYLRNGATAVTEADIRGAGSQARPTVTDAIKDLPSLASAKSDGDSRYWAQYDNNQDPNVLEVYARKARSAPPDGLANGHIRRKWERGLFSGFEPTIHTEAVLRRFGSVLPGMRDDTSRCPRLAWDRQCPTLRAGTGKDRGSYQAVRPIHPTEHRVITVREAARLQGFPDWFLFHPTKWHSFRMIGNSVSPYLAERVLSVIHRALDERLEGGISA